MIVVLRGLVHRRVSHLDIGRGGGGLLLQVVLKSHNISCSSEI